MKNASMLNVLFATLSISCTAIGTVTRTETKQYAMAKSSATDSLTNKIIEPYRDKMSLSMNAVIGESETDLENGQPESRLGNFIADLALEKANKIYYPADNKKADFAFLNSGIFRAAFRQGPITRGEVYKLMPFENELLIMTLKGSTVSKLIDYIIEQGGMPVSNIHIKIRNKIAVEVVINNQAFDSAKTYKVVTSYLAESGDNIKLMEEAISRETTGLKLREAILDQIGETTSSGRKISAHKEGRIIYEQ